MITHAKEAILLVGGQGTRLCPLTINTPKPMLPVAGVPFTVHQILRARDAGIERIVLGTSYRADVFKDFIADANLGIEVVIATEDEPLGTGGAIRTATRQFLSEQLKEGKIKAYCAGEVFGPFESSGRTIVHLAPALRKDTDWGNQNDGITLVVLK